MKKKITLKLILILVVITLILVAVNNKSVLEELNYNEITNKIDNKETFILCITATDCIHCQKYKPKLEKISKEYNITIYYTNIDKLTKEEYETFKKEFSFDGGTPVTLLIKNGTENTTATRIEGNVKEEKIINKLKTNGFIQ